MNAIPQPDIVVDDLTPEFVSGFVDAVAGAEQDRLLFYSEHPDWATTYQQRFVAMLLHERIWGRLSSQFERNADIVVRDDENRREFSVAGKYLVRVKRHKENDKISTYPTRAAQAFYRNPQSTLDGGQTWSLAMGYMWADGAVAYPLVTLRNGIDVPVWGAELVRDTADGIPTIRTRLIEDVPMPAFDLDGAFEEIASVNQGVVGDESDR